MGSLDEVFRARAWLRKHAVPIVFEGRRRAGCQIAIEFTDPDGNNLEIYWNIDQIGTEGHVRPASQWRQARTLEDAVANPVEGRLCPRHSARSTQAGEKGPDARRRPTAAREAYLLYVERAAEGGNEADGPYRPPVAMNIMTERATSPAFMARNELVHVLELARGG